MSYDHLHELVSSCRLVEFRAADNPEGPVVMWRSKCNGTLAERVNELERELAPSRELLLKGGMPGPECFRGDALDVGKLYALKQTAMRIKELGTVWTKCSSRAPSRTHTPIPPGGAGAGRRTHTPIGKPARRYHTIPPA